MKNKEQKEFYLMIKGQKVVVSEEVYRAYIQPVRAEQQQRKRERRCILERIENGKCKKYRCKGNCTTCERYLQGNKNIGIATSFDELVGNGFDMPDTTVNIEEDFIKKEMCEALKDGIKTLTIKQQEIVKLVYFDNLSQVEVAKRLGISKVTVNQALTRIMEILKNFLEK